MSQSDLLKYWDAVGFELPVLRFIVSVLGKCVATEGQLRADVFPRGSGAQLGAKSAESICGGCHGPCSQQFSYFVPRSGA